MRIRKLIYGTSYLVSLSVSSLFGLDTITEKSLLMENTYTIGQGQSAFYQRYDDLEDRWFFYMPEYNYLLLLQGSSSEVINISTTFASLTSQNGVVAFGSVISGVNNSEVLKLAGNSYIMGVGQSALYQKYDNANDKWFFYMPEYNYFLALKGSESLVMNVSSSLPTLQYSNGTVSFQSVTMDDLTAVDNLSTIATRETLDNKSIISAQDDSGIVKFYLTTFNNDTSYKKVQLSSFSNTTLSGTDSEVNATVTSQVSSITSGWCGTALVNSVDNLTMSAVDDESNILTDTTTTYDATYDGTDGNLTINSIDSTVVWFGDSIDLSGVNNCEIDGMPTGVIDPISEFLPPSIPN